MLQTVPELPLRKSEIEAECSLEHAWNETEWVLEWIRARSCAFGSVRVRVWDSWDLGRGLALLAFE